MDGEEFYGAFKDALKYVGLMWGEMDNATVVIKDSELRISFDGRTAVVTAAPEGE